MLEVCPAREVHSGIMQSSNAPFEETPAASAMKQHMIPTLEDLTQMPTWIKFQHHWISLLTFNFDT